MHPLRAGRHEFGCAHGLWTRRDGEVSHCASSCGRECHMVFQMVDLACVVKLVDTLASGASGSVRGLWVRLRYLKCCVLSQVPHRGVVEGLLPLLRASTRRASPRKADQLALLPVCRRSYYRSVACHTKCVTRSRNSAAGISVARSLLRGRRKAPGSQFRRQHETARTDTITSAAYSPPHAQCDVAVVAQLVEASVREREVGGSNPVSRRITDLLARVE